MKYLLSFLAGCAFIIFISARPEINPAISCEEALERALKSNDSLKSIADQQRLEAEVQATVANEQRRIAEQTRTAAENAQEEALIQAERAEQARVEAVRATETAAEYKKQLEACRKNN